MNRQDAYDLAHQLMSIHGLRNDSKPWMFWHLEFNQSKTCLGTCSYRRRTIYLSEPYVLLNDVDIVRDTILHEIAHALTPRADHGPVWQACAVRIGARPTSCEQSANLVNPIAPWQATCPVCANVVHRYRRPDNCRDYGCGHCCKRTGKFDAQFRLVFRRVRT